MIKKNKIILLGVLGLLSCSRIESEKQIAGHWHCYEPRDCLFKTVDATDSTVITDKDVVGGHSNQYLLDRDRVDYDEDIEVALEKNSLILRHSNNLYRFLKSDPNKCRLADRYSNCLLELSLPEAESTLGFDILTTRYNSGNLFIGKLKRGINKQNDLLLTKYQDSVFIQVNDVLINFRDIPRYVSDLKSNTDMPRANINIHANKELPVGFIATVVSLLKPGEPGSPIIHNVVKTPSGDIGLIKWAAGKIRIIEKTQAFTSRP